MEIIEILKAFDKNNTMIVMVLSVIVIVWFTSYAISFYSSSIETIFMSKSDGLKRKSFVYIIFFCVFGLLNYILANFKLFYKISLIFLIVFVILYIILSVIKRFEKIGNNILKWREDVLIMLIITFFADVTYAFSIETETNLLSSALISSLIETVIMMLVYINPVQIKSKIQISLNEKEWYIVKRIDNDFFLCSDSHDMSKSKKYKLIKIEHVIDKNINFKIIDDINSEE